MTILIWINARQLTDIDINRKQVDYSLRASELHFRSTLDSMMEGCQIIGYDWRYIYVNPSAEKQNRRPTKELLGKIYMDMWPGVESTAVYVGLRHCMDKRVPQHMINAFIFPDGGMGWFELSIQPVPDGIFILSSDITSRKQAEQALLEREMKLSMLLDILPVGISILDAERKISFTNPALKTILDISEEGLQDGVYAAGRRYLRADGTPMPMEEMASTMSFQENREFTHVETGIVKEDGSTIWTSVSAVPVDFPDWKLVLVTADITARKQAEQKISRLNAELEEKVAQRTMELAAANKQLHELSILDELTGLHNRRGFRLLADEQLLLARRSGSNLLIFYADLDGLKQVNDQQGHVAGDQAIITVAHALNKTFRASDIKARLGGDEFIVLAMECMEPGALALLARLQERLAQEGLSMSVGVVSFDTQSDLSLADLIARADEAMYEVKLSKRGRPGGRS
jgi:diguanylate cyclase (GGDEF)-like protein/PAS domain S-box-containing protein